MLGKANPVVVVPGIMGSELSIEGKTIWAADHRGLRAVLTPSYLLPWLSVDAGTAISTYEPLINFLKTDLGYKKDELFIFGYDWRRGIEAGAKSLAEYVDDTVRLEHGGQIVFIAHSLGGLIVRWALTSRLIESQKIRLVIAAGPPCLGSPLAFKSVVTMPALNDTFERLCSLARTVFAGAVRRLELSVTRSLMCVTSLMELMPPIDISIIIEEGGHKFSAHSNGRAGPKSLH
jgi:hypothetical protein